MMRATGLPAMTVNQWVDAVYVLSVKSFSQRIEHITRELGKHGIAFEFIFEHDADELDPALLAAVFSANDMKRSHQSLVLKHIQAWRNGAEHGYRRILVFEDDAVLAQDFTAQFDCALRAAQQVPEGYLIFLGGADTKVPNEYFLAPGPLVPLPIATAEGYVTDLAAMKRRLEWLTSNKIHLPADHLIRYLDRELGITDYWLRPPIVEQGSVLGIFDSVLDGHRQKHSRLFNVMRYRWNKFQRHRLRSWLLRIRGKLGL